MSAQSICDIGYKQGAEFFTALQKAGFTGDIVQQVINSRGNKLAKAMYTAVTNGQQTDDRFEYVKTVEVTIPDGYDKANPLDTYKVRHESEYYYYNPGLTDANFAKATTTLTPGRKFAVKVFAIKKGERVTSEDCLAQYKRVNAVLVGAQGLTVLCEQKKGELPKGKYHVSFDEKEALPVLGEYRRVPYVGADSDGDFGLGLGDFGDDWRGDDCLLCFCDIS